MALLLALLLAGCAAQPAATPDEAPPATRTSTSSSAPATTAPAPQDGNATDLGTAPATSTTSSSSATSSAASTSSSSAEPPGPEPTPTGSSTSTSSEPPSSASDSATSTSSTGPSPAPPAKEASALVLLAVDLGNGWGSDPVEDAPGQEPEVVDDANAFSFRPSGTPSRVDITVRVFSSAEHARSWFDAVRADLAGAPLEDVDAGDDAFQWRQSPGSWEEGWVVEGDVVWELYVTGDGGLFPAPTTADLLRMAADKA